MTSEAHFRSCSKLHVPTLSLQVISAQQVRFD